MTQFQDWAARYAKAAAGDRAAMLADGVALATKRRELMRDLIQKQPNEAIRQAVPYGVRKQLPPEILALLEVPVSGRGDLAAHCAFHERAGGGVFRKAEIGGRTYDAYVYGARQRFQVLQAAPLWGVAVDDQLAVGESPLRILDAEEAKDVVAAGKVPDDSTCPVCAKPAATQNQPTLGDYGGDILSFDTAAHAKTYVRVFALGSSGGSGGGGPLGSGNVQGPITLLYMRVVYPDDPVEPISEDAAYQDLDNLNKYYESCSFHTVNVIGVVTPPLMMPYPKKWYETPPPTDPTDPTAAPPKLGDLAQHTLAAARAAGYNPSDYNQTAMRFATLKGIAWTGLSGSPIKLVVNGLTTIGHELGHNIGLGHANYWDTSVSDGTKVTANRIAAPGSPVETTSAIGHETTYGAGKSVEYGDAWSLQGANSAGHFNASEKSQLGWLPDAGVRLFNAAGGDTVRVHSLESDVLEAGKKYAIRVRRSSDREYWFQYRTTVAGNSYLTNGLQIIWSGSGESPNGDSDLLDATPNSDPNYSADRADSALPIGRTFHDPVINLFVTATNQNGTGTTAYMDVVVNIGLFTNNAAPVFGSLASDTNNISPGDAVVLTAAVTDPDFDPLAYYWTFDDGGVAPSAPVVSHTFASAGEYVIRCVASDMKGGTASKSMVIRVGNPNTYRIGGVIRDAAFNPIPDVRVDNGLTGANYRYGYTDSDGSYVIAGNANGSYIVGAWKPGQHLEPNNTFLPININNDSDLNVNWLAAPSTTVWIDRIVNATEGGTATVTLKRSGSMDKELPVVFKAPADTITVNTADEGSDFTQASAVTVTHTNSVPGSKPGTVDFQQVTFGIGTNTLNLTFPTLADGGYEGPEVFYFDLAYELQRYFNYYRIDPVVGFTNTLLDLKMPCWMQNVQPTFDLPPGNPNQNPDSLNFLSPSTYVWAPPGYVIGRPKVDWPAVTINDGNLPALPTVVSVVGSGNRAMENGQDPAEFQFTLSQVLTNDLTVYYTMSGTAVNGQDYTYLPGSFVIPAGVRQFWLPVFAINDYFMEGPENVILTVSASPNYTIGGGSGTVWIGDDDLPSVTITTLDRIATEAGATASFNITRNGNLDLPLTVYYLVSGTATAAGPGQDFQTLSGSVVIPASQPTATVLVRPIPDSVDEGEETVVVTLTSSDLYNIGIPNTVTLVIQDDERNTVTVSSSGTVAEGSTGSFTLTRTGSTTNALTVNYKVEGGAVPGIGADYNSIGNSAVIPAGAASVTISVATFNDTFYEGTETVVLTLLTNPNYNLGAPFQSTLSITDNDPTSNPSVGFLSASTTNSEGVMNVKIPVLLSAPPPRNTFATSANYTNGSPAVIKVNYNVTAGNAVGGGVDYSFNSGTLVWSNIVWTLNPNTTLDDVTNDTSILPPDGLAQMISFTVNNDGILKSPTNRSFVITLSNWVENVFVGPTHQFLTRLRTAGDAEDPTFASFGYGPNGSVNDVLLLSDSTFMVAGNFSSINATNAVRIAHVLNTGWVDTNYLPNWLGCDREIMAIARQNTALNAGKFVIGGVFTNIWTGLGPPITFNTAYRRLARINTDGTRDTGFAGGGIQIAPTDPAAFVDAVVVDANDYIYVGGSFTNISGAPGGGPTNFCRLLPGGGLDTAFNANTKTGPNGRVRSILVRGDGSILIGGDFTSYGGTTANRLALLNPDGTFNANWNINGNVYQMVPADGAGYVGGVLIVGAFTQVAGTINANRIAVLNAGGGFVGAFETTGALSGADGTVYSAAILSTGDIAIGGDFNNIGDGTPAASNVRTAHRYALLNSQGNFKATLPSSGPEVRYPGATVKVVRVNSANAIYLGGDFLPDVFPYPNNYTFDIYRSHTYVIQDDDLATVQVTANPATAVEGGQSGAFVVNMGTPATSPVTVNFSVTGTAARGADYVLRTNGVVLATSTLTIPAGTNQVVVTVEPIDDTVPEFAETVKLSLVSVVGGHIGGPSSATVTITDNDASLQFQFATISALESAGVVPVTIVRDGTATNKAVTVDYLINNGTAVNGVDYFATNGTVSFAANQVITNFFITLSNNIVVDGNRTINLMLTNVTGGLALGGQSTCTFTIVDDDTAFQFAVTNFVTTELSTNGVVNISRLGLSTNTDTVEFAAFDGTATNGVDFTGVTNQLVTFAPGVTNMTVLVPVLTNTNFTGDLQVNLALANPSGTTALGVSNTTATLTIRDDECRLTFATDQYSVNEYAGSVVLTVNRVGGTINPVSVDFSTLNGAALAGSDYFTNFGTLNFTGDVLGTATDGSGLTVLVPGETNKTITVTIMDDQKGEYDETFTVNLSNPVGGPVINSTTLGTIPTATVTIVDNEQPGDVIYEFAGAAGGGANGRVVALGRQSDGKVIVGGQFTTVDGTSFNRVARFLTNGLVDGSFIIGAGANGDVTALVVRNDDQIYLAGAFTTFNLTNRAGIALLNADGSLDGGFDPGTGANNVVRALLVQPNGQVIIAGDFTAYNGTNVTRLARLNPNGSLDLSFSASADASVYSLALQPDGKVVLAGAFTHVNGASANRVARLNADGSIDNTFGGAGTDAPIFSVALQGDGKVVLGGAFTFADGTARNFLARLQTNGVIDAAFNPGTGPDGSVNAVGVDVNGKILIGGNFTNYNGTSHSCLARIKSNGQVDAFFDVGTGPNAPVQAVLVQANTAVVIGGDFTQVNGIPRNRVALIHGDEATNLSTMEFASVDYPTVEGVNADIVFIRYGATNVPVSFTFYTTDGTATNGTHYTAVSNTVTFAVGQRRQTNTVVIANDFVPNDPRTVNLFMTNAVGGFLDTVTNATLTINDNDVLFSFAAAGGVITREGDGTVAIGILRTGSTNQPVSVYFSTTNGTGIYPNGADAPGEFAGQTNTLVNFAAGQISNFVTLTLVDDSIVEPDKQADLGLSDTGTNGLNVTTLSPVTLTILDDESTLQFGFTAASAVESGGSVTLNVTRGDYTGGTVTVRYSTVDQSAVAGSDYLGVANALLTFGPGVTSLPITITNFNNKLAEADETFQVVLSAPTGGGILGANTTAQVTILDDDSIFTIGDQSVMENGTNVTLTVTRNFLAPEATNRTATVNFATASGTAISGTHFTSTSGTLTFGPDTLTQTITVPIINNQATNANRTFKVNLSGPGGEAALGVPNSATVTIVDNDSALQFSAGAVSVLEGVGTLTLTVTRTGDANSTVTVPVSFTDGTAINGTDYLGTNNPTLTFGTNVTTQTVVVGLLNNTLAQSNRVFTATLGAPTGEASLVGNTNVTVTIVDDDSVIQFAFTNLNVAETANNFPAQITRTGYTSNSVMVTLTSTDLTAVSGVDYTPINASLVFAAGETNKIVNVPILNDSIIEGSLAFRLSLGSPLTGEVQLGGKSNLVVTIQDDDFRLVVPASTTVTAESFAPTNAAIDPYETVTVNFAMRNIGNVPTTNLVATLLPQGGVGNPSGPQTYGALQANSGNVVTQSFSFTVVTNDNLRATFQLQDGTINLGTVSFDLPLGAAVSFTNKDAINIPGTLTVPSSGQASAYPSVIAVSNLAGVVQTVTVRLDRLTHSWPDDIDILLVSPGGQMSYVMSDVGGGGSITDVTLVFDERAASSLANSGQIVSGTYKPTNFEVPDNFVAPAPSGPYATNFASFGGSNPNGNWSLFIMDDVGDNTGVLLGGWSLTITTIIPAVGLDLTVTDSPDPLVLGNNVAYLLVVTNRGPVTATSVVLTNTLSTDMAFVSATNSQGSFNRIGNVIRFDLGSLAGGGGANFGITATVTAGGYLTNVAQVSMLGGGLGLSSSAATNVTSVSGGAKVSAVQPSPAAPMTNGFVLTIGRNVNIGYVIEASTNLIDWTAIATNWANGSNSIQFVDTNSPSFGQRFYRTIEKP